MGHQRKNEAKACDQRAVQRAAALRLAEIERLEKLSQAAAATKPLPSEQKAKAFQAGGADAPIAAADPVTVTDHAAAPSASTSQKESVAAAADAAMRCAATAAFKEALASGLATEEAREVARKKGKAAFKRTMRLAKTEPAASQPEEASGGDAVAAPAPVAPPTSDAAPASAPMPGAAAPEAAPLAPSTTWASPFAGAVKEADSALLHQEVIASWRATYPHMPRKHHARPSTGTKRSSMPIPRSRALNSTPSLPCAYACASHVQVHVPVHVSGGG